MGTKKQLSIVIGFTLILACKRTELTDDKSILVGNWKWAYTIEQNYWPSSPYYVQSTLTPSTTNKDFSMELLEKGKIHLHEGSKCKSYRLIIKRFDYYAAGDFYEADMEYDNLKKHGMLINVFDRMVDSLKVYGSFPYENNTDDEGHQHFYVSTFYRSQ